MCVSNLIETLSYSAIHSTVRCVEFRLYVSHHSAHLNLQQTKNGFGEVYIYKSLHSTNTNILKEGTVVNRALRSLEITLTVS